MTDFDRKIRTAILAGTSAALLLTGAKDFPALAESENAVAARPRSTRVADLRYRDGVYTATGQYGNGPSFLTVTVTLAEDIVTHVEVKTPATNPISLIYQRRFAAAVPAVVVGKPIGQLRVGRLAGSSGTPDGFNAAIALIREQAAR